MNKSDIAPEVAEQEQAIQQQINTAIDAHQSIVFEAGAGAGKTYALVESLKHIVNCHGERLLTHQQKVTCITYTNVAANEINKRLGQSEIAQISTIHERLWAIISPYQEELVEIHRQHLLTKVAEIEKVLSNSDEIEAKIRGKFNQYYAAEDKQGFKACLIANREKFEEVKNAKAGPVKDTFKSDIEEFGYELKSAAKFQGDAKKVLEQYDYSQVIESIDNKDKGFTSISYRSTTNIESLAKMRISHDTLLDYAEQLITQHDLLKRLIIDTSPFFLVDEYQDTSPCVVKALDSIDKYATKHKLPWFVGYFGDCFQNIYEKGVGADLVYMHEDLVTVAKEFNRRSVEQVISLGNIIKQYKSDIDVLVQKSIYESFTGSDVKFFHCVVGNDVTERATVVEEFITARKGEWVLKDTDKVDCLVLLNKTMATLNDFGGFYQAFEKVTDYRNMKTVFLNKDKEQLTPLAGFIFRLMEFGFLCNDDKSALTQIGSREQFNKLKLAQLKSVIKQVRNFNPQTLRNYLDSLFNIIDKMNPNEQKYFKALLFGAFSEDNVGDNFEEVVSWSMELYDWRISNGSDKAEELEEKLRAIFDTPFEQCDCWLNFLNDNSQHGNAFHTFHGTKGDEFDNVVVVLEKGFGRGGANKFSNFFTKPSADVDDFENTRNILYVACTRAKHNLAVLYLDDFSEIKAEVEQVFDIVECYQ